MMSKQPVVKPKTAVKPKNTTANARPLNSVAKDEAKSSEDNSTDNDEEFARQLQEQMLREQEELDADLARRLHEEEENKRAPPVFHPATRRPVSAAPLRQLFQTMLGLRPEALEVEDESDENDTPTMDPDSPDAANATAAAGSSTPRRITGATGISAGRGDGRGLPFRRGAGASPERARRVGFGRSPERPIRGRGFRRTSSDSGNNNNETPSEPLSPVVDQLPGVRPNPAFRPAPGLRQRPARMIVLQNTNPPDDAENPRPIGEALRPLLGEREATMNLPENEYDPDFMVLDLGVQERQREANFINIMRDPFLLMLLLMGRDPGFMVPEDVDLGDYEALWELAERIGEVQSRGMKEEEINRLPYRTYRKKSGKSDESCSICMSEYKTADHVQILPCQHEYHKECLLEWLKRNATCPVCRQDVKKKS